MIFIQKNIFSKSFMDSIYSFFLKKGIFLFFFILSIVYQYQTASAQSEEEMKLLLMFYEEKDLVVSPTRYPKSITQVAENITVVTSKEIEAMKAHSLSEILNRIPGFLVSFNQDFGAASLLFIQGSEERHVLVLVDGVAWNFLATGAAETNSIPVGIIERIEIIKGPASSAWGSALGGVVNVITKSTGTTKRPTGSIQASYGKGNTQDYRAQVSGRAGPVGYYLFAGLQDSDGLRSSRHFNSDNLYAKITLSLSEDTDLDLTLGYSNPHTGLGDFPSLDITSTGIVHNFFTTASIEISLPKEFSLCFSLYTLRQKADMRHDLLDLGFINTAEKFLLEDCADEKTTGGSTKLAWKKGRHTAVFGLDFDHGKLHKKTLAGQVLQLRGVPTISWKSSVDERWALYVNDTIFVGRWSITPGIRYDHNSIAGSFISPSLGLTYRLGEDSILRASIARGFTIPPLILNSSGALFIDPNRSLEPEEVWSYQAGMETSSFKYFWIKATLFYHELDKEIKRKSFAGGPPNFNDLPINKGKIKRQGLELEAETIPLHNLTFWGGVAYVHITPPHDTGTADVHSYTLGLRYDDRESFRAEFFGHYLWWDMDHTWDAEYDDFIWDITLTKKIHAYKKTAIEIFVIIHNLFNSSQYSFTDNKNPKRWTELGIRVEF